MRAGSQGDDYLDTPRGEVLVICNATPEFISSLELDGGMGIFAAPNYPPTREKKALERIAKSKDSNIIIAYTKQSSMVGFVVIAPPSKAERWGKQSTPDLLEAMAIEVSREWRSLGIADKMMEVGLRDSFFDDKIVLCTGYTWHWDLDSTALDKESYRRMLLSYLEKAGFVYYETDEPNVNLDACNFLTARIGPGVGHELYNRFEEMLFKDQAWADFKGRPRIIGDVLGESDAWRSLDDD
ncbi:MAG: hypothetical protein SWK76_11060 [Actinomycetota bacterium]|nr:hypothetical protein [Actinomycetota bacterium]